MNDSWRSGIPQLSTQSLIALAQDAEKRIGSHAAGGDPDEGYLEKQRYLLSLIQDEIGRRG